MRKITVVLFDELPGGTAPYQDASQTIEFFQADPNGRLPEFTGASWMLVDWAPKALSGLEICRRLRCNPRAARARITMVLAEDSVAMRRRAIASGANDCLVGPIDRMMLLGRVLGDGILDIDDGTGAWMQHDDLVFDICACQVRWREKPIPMMPVQLRLLRFFMEHPGQIYTRAQLMVALGHDAPQAERTVDVWIGRLRQALREAGAGDLLRTVRSFGYMLDRPSGRRGLAK